jgi:hypothetical protein
MMIKFNGKLNDIKLKNSNSKEVPISNTQPARDKVVIEWPEKTRSFRFFYKDCSTFDFFKTMAPISSIYEVRFHAILTFKSEW